MRIIKFGVNNFRTINGILEKNLIDFENSNTIFLFGQNNVGKSSFLQAYDYFYHNTPPSEDDFYLKKTDNNIVFELEVELNSLDKERIDSNNKGEFLLNNYISKKDRLRIRKIWDKDKREIDETYKPEENIWDDKFFGGIGLHGVFQQYLPTPILIKAMSTEAENEIIVKQILEVKAKEYLDSKAGEDYKKAKESFIELQDKLYSPDVIKNCMNEVNKRFQKLFDDTEIKLEDMGEKNPFTLSIIGKKFGIKFKKIDGDEQIPDAKERIGHGAIRTAMFSLCLMKDIAEGFERVTGRKDYLVLFEEPELFLHPRLVKLLRDLIYDVSGEDTPYQVLCASHSPQMIDVTKPKSSLVRMVKIEKTTRIFQIDETFLMEGKNKVKQELYEILRFNPFICESFYANEVILVEGDTEAVIIRAYMQKKNIDKELFVVNCGTVNNIPFFQDMFAKFNIKYHVICDTDGHFNDQYDELGNPIFSSHIQGKIYDCIKKHSQEADYKTGLFRINNPNFEEAHRKIDIEELKYKSTDLDIQKNGKPYCANDYWNNILDSNIDHSNIDKVLIIKYIKEIIAY